jgi:hypothetical protein
MYRWNELTVHVKGANVNRPPVIVDRNSGMISVKWNVFQKLRKKIEMVDCRIYW